MSIDVRVPTTGNAGEDAVVVSWNVAEGATVSSGDVLVVLETAKSTIDIEAPEDGHVLTIRYAEGDEVPEHAVLAILGAPGETVDAEPEIGLPAALEEPSAPADTPSENPATASTDVPSEVQPASISSDSGRIAASPRARVLAERNGIHLEDLTGTGPGGRIIVGDVLGAKVRPASPPAAAQLVAPLAGHQDEFTLVPVRGARKVTAQRMHESLQNTAQVTLTRYAQADAMLDFVQRLRVVTEAQGLEKIGVNDILLFATARAVAKHPEANSWFSWDGIRQFSAVNIGFAVDTGAALLVPVIRGANALSLSAVAAAAHASIAKAKAGKLTTDEMEGGTFTVSNLGSLGVHWFTPVLNPPQSCILGVGATHQLHPEGGHLLPLSLTFDHRAIDGAAAAILLGDIVAAIESADVLTTF